MTRVRGIRGATTATENSGKAILAATRELLREIVARNQLDISEVASALFTTTPDLNSEFPAVAARQLGWTDVPLMCGHEMAVPGALTGCVRVLVHVNTEKGAGEINHVYLHGAANLRSAPPPIDD